MVQPQEVNLDNRSVFEDTPRPHGPLGKLAARFFSFCGVCYHCSVVCLWRRQHLTTQKTMKDCLYPSQNYPNYYISVAVLFSFILAAIRHHGVHRW